VHELVGSAHSEQQVRGQEGARRPREEGPCAPRSAQPHRPEERRQAQDEDRGELERVLLAYLADDHDPLEEAHEAEREHEKHPARLEDPRPPGHAEAEQRAGDGEPAVGLD
jgi:hypothetical protein